MGWGHEKVRTPLDFFLYNTNIINQSNKSWFKIIYFNFFSFFEHELIIDNARGRALQREKVKKSETFLFLWRLMRREDRKWRVEKNYTGLRNFILILTLTDKFAFFIAIGNKDTRLNLKSRTILFVSKLQIIWYNNRSITDNFSVQK